MSVGFSTEQKLLWLSSSTRRGLCMCSTTMVSINMSCTKVLYSLLVVVYIYVTQVCV